MTITNPYSRGYLAYLAAVDGWLKISDELVIVDGGSSDESLEKLFDWVGRDSRVRVVSNDITFWGEGEAWHVGQACINANVAIDHLAADWGAFPGGDCVPYMPGAGRLREQLAEHGEAIWVRTFRAKPSDGRIVHRFDERSVVFNLRRIRESGLRVGFGIDSRSGFFSDFPIRFEWVAEVVDPATGARKPIYAGTPIAAGGTLDLECAAYGHFFYDRGQLDRKIERWERAVSRFDGRAPARLAELRLRHGSDGIGDYYSREEVLEWDHPAEMLRLLREHYTSGMVGGGKRHQGSVSRALGWAAETLLKSERRVRTVLRRGIGIEGDAKSLEWKRLDQDGLEPASHGVARGGP